MAVSAARAARQPRLAQWRENLKRATKRSTAILAGAALCAGTLLLLAALVSYRPSDPSLNTAAAGPASNWLGTPGAYASDLLLSLMGPFVGLLLPLLILLGIRLARGVGPGRWIRSFLLPIFGVALLGTAAALLIEGAINGLPGGWGGAFGLGLAKLVGAGIALIGQPSVDMPLRLVAMTIAAGVGLFLCYLGLGIRAEERDWLFRRRGRAADLIEDRHVPTDLEEDEERDERPTRIGVAAAPPRVRSSTTA